MAKQGFTMVQRTAMMLQKIGMYEDRQQIILSELGRLNTTLRDLSHYELIAIQDWCKRYAHSNGIALDKEQPKKEVSRDQESADRMRKKIIYYAHLMKWEVAGGKVNMDKINNWCKSRGMFKKALMLHTVTELTQLVSQFEKVYKSFLKEVAR